MGEKSTRMTAIVALMAVFGLGISFIIVGAISEEMKESLGITNAEIGSLTFALFLTSMIVQLLIGPLVDKFGHRPLAILGFLIAGASMFVLAYSTNLSAALIGCVMLGIGAMCLNTVGNTLVPVVLFDGKDPARASNFGNAFFGLGYVITPLIFSLFASLSLNYRAGVSIIGGLLLLFFLIATGVSFPKVSTGFRFSMAVRLLGKGAVLIAALALFCYIALEISMATWSKPFMTEIFGGDKSPGAVTTAGLVLSFFGVAMMVGRFLTSTIKNLTAIGVKVIAASALISIVALLLMILTHSATLAISAVLLVGLVFAPIFPTIVGITFAKFEPKLYGSIFGIIFAVGLLGGTFIPQLIGRLSVGATVQESLYIVVAMAAILFVIALFIDKIGKPASSKP